MREFDRLTAYRTLPHLRYAALTVTVFMAANIKQTLDAAAIVRRLAGDRRVQRAGDFFRRQAEAITVEQMRICEIPSSPFKEAERAGYFHQRFGELNLDEVETDAEGNVTGIRRGANHTPLVVVSAHLDTVFPEGTNFSVTREGNTLRAPGAADDGCGLTGLIALIQALDDAAIETEGSVLFVATVGEEGIGDLRGARHLLTDGRYAKQVTAFLSLDGPGIEGITNTALGSRRYQIKLISAGGHSWGDFGTPNPVHAAGRFIRRMVDYPLPREVRAAYNIGRIEGGTSVNAIPAEASVEVDLRAETPEELARLDGYFHQALHEAVAEENRARHYERAPLKLELARTGNRPGGATSETALITQLAVEATRLCGARPLLNCSSTDSNIAISLGIPALTVGAGGTAGGSHTLDEWYDASGRHQGLERDLLVLLGLVGISPTPD